MGFAVGGDRSALEVAGLVFFQVINILRFLRKQLDLRVMRLLVDAFKVDCVKHLLFGLDSFSETKVVMARLQGAKVDFLVLILSLLLRIAIAKPGGSFVFVHGKVVLEFAW
jgi:hypothetical protein